MEAGTPVGDTVREMVAEAETEAARLIAYVNDEVVPEVRRGSARGLRAIAAQLDRMAAELGRDGAQAAEHAGPSRANGVR